MAAGATLAGSLSAGSNCRTRSIRAFSRGREWTSRASSGCPPPRSCATLGRVPAQDGLCRGDARSGRGFPASPGEDGQLRLVPLATSRARVARHGPRHGLRKGSGLVRDAGTLHRTTSGTTSWGDFEGLENRVTLQRDRTGPADRTCDFRRITEGLPSPKRAAARLALARSRTGSCVSTPRRNRRAPSPSSRANLDREGDEGRCSS